MRFSRLLRRPKAIPLVFSILVLASIISVTYVTTDVLSAFHTSVTKTGMFAAAAPVIAPKLKPTAVQLKASKVPVKYVASIAKSETWGPTKAGVYVVNGPVTIPKGKVLTISPGTIIKYAYATSKLIVSDGANIIVSGTAINPVVFTGIKDDSVGGDTNKDKAVTKLGLSDYDTAINVGGAADIKYAIIKGGSQSVAFGNTGNGVSTANLFSIRDSVLYGQLSMQYCTVKPVSILRNQFIVTNANAVADYYSDVSGLKLAGADRNIFEGIGRSRAVYLQGSVIPAGKVWDVSGLGKQVLVLFDLQLNGKTTVSDGAIIKNSAPANGIDYGIRVYRGATLSTTFSSNAKVVFASYTDDTVGGDTNGDGATALKLDGLAIRGTGGSINLAKADVKSLGTLMTASCDSTSGKVTISDSTISSFVLIQSCSKAQYSLKRNVFSVPSSSKPLELLSSNVEGLVTQGPDKNTFIGTGQSRVVYLNSSYLIEGSQWALTTDTNAIYEVNWFTVSGRLEVRPGVVVKTVVIGSYQVTANGIDVKGKGSLIANGTAISPITFTSLSDDTIGGDSNGDGNTSVATETDYPTTINSSTSGMVQLSYVTVRNTSNALTAACNETGYVSLTDSQVYSPVQLTYCTTAATSVKRNIFKITWGVPLQLTGSALPNVVLDGGVDTNKFIGIGNRQVVRVSSELAAGSTWNVSGKTGAVLVAVSFKVKGTLNLKDGQIVKVVHNVWPYRDMFFTAEDNARITMTGTALQPITITDIADNSAGGDSQANAGQPYNTWFGHLTGLGVGGNAKVDGTFVNSRHAGYAFNVYGEGAELDLRDSTVTDSTVALLVNAGVVTYRGSIKNMTGNDHLIKSCDWDTVTLCSVDAAYVDWGTNGVKVGNFPDAVCGRLSVSPWKTGAAISSSNLFNVENCSGRPKPSDVLANATAYYQQRAAQRQIDCSNGFQDACDAMKRALGCYGAAVNVATDFYNIPLKYNEPKSVNDTVSYTGQVTAKAADVMVNTQEQPNPTKFNINIATGLLDVAGIVKSLSDAYGTCSP